MENSIVLTSKDNLKFSVSLSNCSISLVIKKLLDEMPDLSEIPCSETNGFILSMLADYLNRKKGISEKELPKPFTDTSLEGYVSEEDYTFINSLDRDELFELIEAASYLEVESLVDLACAHVACKIKKLSPLEAAKFLGAEEDMTEEESKKMEAEFYIENVE